MNFRIVSRVMQLALVVTSFFSCSGRKGQDQFNSELKDLNLRQGNITLCGSGVDQFGTVAFDVSCSEKVRSDFSLATSLLHSFEYTEAEKVFAKVIEQDPTCVMAYWGAAMCNFHPLWAAPGTDDLRKGSKIIALARSINKGKSSRESDYLEAIATIYDHWDTLDYRARVLKFEQASEKLATKYPEDKEAAIFYALALDASADPSDKSFRNQKKAGDILNAIFKSSPNHPGVAHYIIHNYDYPELAELGLPAARKYASIAAASAHAQHMPSHIFTRLGLWDEVIESNIKSVAAAQCYAQNIGAKGHWDEELHGLDYLTYAYLQKGDDKEALEQINYLKTIKEVFPQNFKDAYTFAAMPVRYALERKDWIAAAKVVWEPADFPWNKFPWEKANVNFGRLLGFAHLHQLTPARNELEQLRLIYTELTTAHETYKSNLVLIQIKTGEAWIKLEEGHKEEAIQLMTEAADKEDATAKHPVTPGEILPARELLGDMYFETKDYGNALNAYEADLARHQNRFNGLYGAGLALEKTGATKNGNTYFEKLRTIMTPGKSNRPQIEIIESAQHGHAY